MPSQVDYVIHLLRFFAKEAYVKRRKSPVILQRLDEQMIKVVLINAISPYLGMIDYSDIPIPYGLGYLVAATRQALPRIDISIADDMDELMARKPDIVGISAMTDNYAIAVQWGRRIKATLNVPIIIGGVHISLAPESMESCFDVAVMGEGEITFVELLRSFIRHSRLEHAELADIPGLYFHDRGKPVLTASRPLIEDLDTIAFPGKDVLVIAASRYRPYVFSARGCPYNCTFCSAKALFKGYRSHSIDYIVRQIQDLIAHENVSHIYFADDLFFANKEKLEALVERLRQRNLLGKCSFSCWARANLVSEEICQLLKKLNVTHVGLGVESFSDVVLRGLNKTGVTAKVNQRAIGLLSASGFVIDVTLIYATPYDDRDEMVATFRTMFQNLKTGNIMRVDAGPLRPYPGTSVWQAAKARGIVSENMDWKIFLNPISYTGQVIEELYLGEKVDFQTCRDIHREWKTKYTLFCNQIKRSVQGTMFVDDANQLVEDLAFLDAIVQRRQAADQESAGVGDALIRCSTNPIYMEGCWPEENDEWFWMSACMRVVIKNAANRAVVFQFMALDFFENIGMLPMTLTVRCDGRIESAHLIKAPGVVTIRSDELAGNSKSFLAICFETDHSFVPAALDRGSDTRSLSLLVRIAEP